MLSMEKANKYRDLSLVVLVNLLFLTQLILEEFAWPVLITLICLHFAFKSKTLRVLCLIVTVIVYALHYEKYRRIHHVDMITYFGYNNNAPVDISKNKAIKAGDESVFSMDGKQKKKPQTNNPFRIILKSDNCINDTKKSDYVVDSGVIKDTNLQSSVINDDIDIQSIENIHVSQSEISVSNTDVPIVEHTDKQSSNTLENLNEKSLLIKKDTCSNVSENDEKMMGEQKIDIQSSSSKPLGTQIYIKDLIQKGGRYDKKKSIDVKREQTNPKHKINKFKLILSGGRNKSKLTSDLKNSRTTPLRSSVSDVTRKGCSKIAKKKAVNECTLYNNTVLPMRIGLHLTEGGRHDIKPKMSGQKLQKDSIHLANPVVSKIKFGRCRLSQLMDGEHEKTSRERFLELLKLDMNAIRDLYTLSDYYYNGGKIPFHLDYELVKKIRRPFVNGVCNASFFLNYYREHSRFILPKSLHIPPNVRDESETEVIQGLTYPKFDYKIICKQEGTIDHLGLTYICFCPIFHVDIARNLSNFHKNNYTYNFELEDDRGVFNMFLFNDGVRIIGRDDYIFRTLINYMNWSIFATNPVGDFKYYHKVNDICNHDNYFLGHNDTYILESKKLALGDHLSALCFRRLDKGEKHDRVARRRYKHHPKSFYDRNWFRKKEDRKDYGE